MSQRRSRVSFAAVCLLAAAAFFLSGCVYLRLLELKHQIAAFDQNFTIDSTDGFRIVCQHPVLLTGDVRWIGLEPEKTTKLGTAERWSIRWVKELPPEVHEAGAFDLQIEMMFADDKLSRVIIPERYFVAMPKQLLVDLLRSLGRAKVDRDARAIEAQLAGARPDLPGIEKLLGQPSRRTIEGTQTTYGYRYVPTSNGPARAAVFDMTLVFDTTTRQLLRWEGKTPVGKLGFNFER